MANEDEIRAMAYKLWEEEGRPPGKHEEHYFRAVRLLEQQEGTNSPPRVSGHGQVIVVPLTAPTSLPQTRNKTGPKKTK